MWRWDGVEVWVERSGRFSQHDAGGSDFHGFSPVSCPSAVKLGKEAQPNENAGDQLTQDEIQLIT